MAGRFNVKLPWSERLSGEEITRTPLKARVYEMSGLPVAKPAA